MAKAQEKQVFKESGQDRTNSNNAYTDFRDKTYGQTDVNQSDMNREHDDVYGRYSDIAATGGIDPALRERLLSGNYSGINIAGGSGGSGGSGGISSSGPGGGNVPTSGARATTSAKNSSGNPAGLRPGAGTNTPLGGDHYKDVGFIDRNQFNEAKGMFKSMDLSTAKRFADTGGLEDADLERMRGLGVYDEFARTGGFSDTDTANIRAKALSPIGAFAQNERNELATRRNVQGGYSPGFDASQRALKRDTARNIASTSLDAELGISDRVREGRQWGASNAASSEMGIEQLRTSNQLEGSRQVAQIQQAMAQGVLGAQQGQAMIDQANQQTQLAIATGRTNKDIAELQRRAAAGNASAARELAQAQLSAQNMRFVMELEQQGKLAGIGGMNNTYQFGGQQYGQGMNNALNSINAQTQGNLGYGNLRSQQADQIGGPMDGIKTGVNLAAGMAGAFFNPAGAAGQGLIGNQPFAGSQSYWS